MLSGPARAYWGEPDQLKYVLGPVVATNKAEQQRFYEIFDQYYREVTAEAEQARLDQACADAREKLLSVERAQLVEECVAKKFPRDDRAGCERFYADHGAAAGGRAPLHMDLPECVAAHENRQGR